MPNNPSIKKCLVISSYGRDNLIQCGNQNYNTTKRKNAKKLVVGDFVEFNGEVITKLLPRKNILTANKKYIASNIDIIFLTLAIKPYPQLSSIDNYLIKALSSNIELKIIINKCDIAEKKNIEQLAKIYTDIGYSVDFVSADTQTNLDIFTSYTKNKTCVFVGQSGVGKSSIINCLTNQCEYSQKINILGKDGLGKHTTTSSKIFFLENGGKIIDTPGVREFNPENLSKDEIINGFIEFKQFLGACKFNNCQHNLEPECEIKKQLALNNISKYRYNNYINLITEFEQFKRIF